jgi:hypothetical protein
MIDPRKLTALGEETRGHPPAQIRKICRSLRAFGFVYPILADDNDRVIGGWALILAARELRLNEVPVVTITGLSEPRARMLRLALNRLAEDSHWDRGALRRECCPNFADQGRHRDRRFRLRHRRDRRDDNRRRI